MYSIIAGGTAITESRHDIFPDSFSVNSISNTPSNIVKVLFLDSVDEFLVLENYRLNKKTHASENNYDDSVLLDGILNPLDVAYINGEYYVISNVLGKYVLSEVSNWELQPIAGSPALLK